MQFYIMRHDKTAIMGTDHWLSRGDALRLPGKIVTSQNKRQLENILQKTNADFRKSAKIVTDVALTNSWIVLVNEFGALEDVDNGTCNPAYVAPLKNQNYRGKMPYYAMKRNACIYSVRVPAPQSPYEKSPREEDIDVEEPESNTDTVTPTAETVCEAIATLPANNVCSSETGEETEKPTAGFAGPRQFTDEVVPGAVLSALTSLLAAMDMLDAELAKTYYVINNCEAQIMDLEHYIEFFPLDLRRSHMAIKQIHEARELRREYKDILELDRIVHNFFSENNKEYIRKMIHDIETKNNRSYKLRDPDSFDMPIPEAMKR